MSLTDTVTARASGIAGSAFTAFTASACSTHAARTGCATPGCTACVTSVGPGGCAPTGSAASVTNTAVAPTGTSAAAALQAQAQKPRKRPRWMCEARDPAAKKMTFPLYVLTLAHDLEEARVSIASRERSIVMQEFLESEVHAVLRVTERTFSSDQEEHALHSDLRSAAESVVSSVQSLLDGMFVELGDSNWPRARCYDQLVSHARQLSAVYTGAETVMYHPMDADIDGLDSDLDGLDASVATAFAVGVLENRSVQGTGVDEHPWC